MGPADVEDPGEGHAGWPTPGPGAVDSILHAGFPNDYGDHDLTLLRFGGNSPTFGVHPKHGPSGPGQYRQLDSGGIVYRSSFSAFTVISVSMPLPVISVHPKVCRTQMMQHDPSPPHRPSDVHQRLVQLVPAHGLSGHARVVGGDHGRLRLDAHPPHLAGRLTPRVSTCRTSPADEPAPRRSVRLSPDDAGGTMVSERQALSAWQDRLEEEIGVDESARVVDRVGSVATRADLNELRAATRTDFAEFRAATREDLDGLGRALGNELKAAWRRDLLTFAVPQFLVLVGIVVSVAA